jgi:hypothetical protein
MNNLVVPYDIIKELIINGVRFKYLSYNHKKALEWLNTTQKYTTPNQTLIKISYVPNELKDQFPIWRTGRIWEITFNRVGEIVKVYIGKNPKFKKAFYIQDFGIKFKPILFISDDKHNLITNNLAVEEEL